MFAYWIIVNYREAYGMHLTNGILFNHESPRRGPTFVTRKITRAVARIKKGTQDMLYLGNLDAQRDWGHARDYIEGMWLMVQRDTPDDYVLATGECHSVREFVEESFAHIGITIEWKGAKGTVDEIGVDKAQPDRELVKIDPKYFRRPRSTAAATRPRPRTSSAGSPKSRSRPSARRWSSPTASSSRWPRARRPRDPERSCEPRRCG